MAYDEDAVLEAIGRLRPRFEAIEARLDAIEAQPATGADPLVDAWDALTDAINDAQDGLSRSERVAKLNEFATAIRGAQ
jgi:hypothetical protein